jgi:rubrerythrin
MEDNAMFCRGSRNRKINSAFDIVIDYKNRRAEAADRLEAELVQAVEDIRALGRMGANICPLCAHYNHGMGSKTMCPACPKLDNWEWRGIVKEG